MIFGLLLLLVALAISAVGVFYSISGLAAIFSGAVIPIIVMGAALEAGKIGAIVWMHKYWRRANLQFKLYLVPAIIVLMLITSMGIYGFLAKAHLSQVIPSGDAVSKVQILDERIATERSNIDADKKALSQMNAQVDQLLGRTTDENGANRAVQIRRNQAKERKALQDEIVAAQQNIVKLQDERAPIAAQSRKIEADVGPIRYVAALIYGDNPDSNLLERAVRWVIVILVLVFDPLALVLILAAQQTMAWAREDKLKIVVTSDEKLEKEAAAVRQYGFDKEDLVETAEPEPTPEQEIPVSEHIVETPNDLHWDEKTKVWEETQPPVESHEWKQGIARRVNRVAPGYKRIDGNVVSEAALRGRLNIPLARVKELVDKLTREEITVDSLTWIECDAIQEYLEK